MTGDTNRSHYVIWNFLVATFKKQKERSEINFNNLYYPIHPKYYPSSICNQYKNIEAFCIILLRLGNIYTDGTFQEFHRHLWPVTTVCESRGEGGGEAGLQEPQREGLPSKRQRKGTK